MIKTVIKRDGTEEPFSHEKLNKLSQWTTDVLTPQEHNIDWSEIALDAVKRLYNNCNTEDIVQALIQSCLDRREEGYLYAAGKLLISDLYKDIYNSDIPPTLIDYLEFMIDKEFYQDFLEEYSEEELLIIDSYIDHSRDFTLTHSQVNQMMSKYLLQNKITKKCYETPQFMFMRVALAVCSEEENRLEKIKIVYNLLSNFHLNLPTPMWVNLGTPTKAGTSCLLYAVDDTIGSLNAGDNISYIMTTAGAGIGSAMFTRSVGQPIKNGRLVHAGKIPYFKLLEATIQAAIQGPRGGAATTYINALDPQIETLIHLKNPISIPEQKVVGIDYAFSFNNFLLQKAKANEEWMLIDYSIAKDLYQAMYAKDESKFEELYYKYLKDDSITKKIVKARELVVRFIKESHATGRLYEFNTTNANSHTAYKDPIYSSNLCTEILLPTKPFKHRKELDKEFYEEGDGWVQTCNLAAINLNKNYSDEEYKELAYWSLKIIDYVIDNSYYIMPQIGVTTKLWRSAGVSVINLAHHLAKNSFNYTSVESKKHMHSIFERHEYMLLRASLLIAKERGNAPWIHKTKYPEGYLPIDDYNKNVDKIADFEYIYDWESLRKDIIENKGIAHTALSTAVPSESSSILSNSTNGLYPVRDEVTIKTGVNTKNTTIPPEYSYLNYQISYDIPTIDLIHMYAIAQKFISQGISADFYFDLTREKDKDTKNLFNLLLARNYFGLKTKYYSNFRTQDEDSQSYMSDQKDVKSSNEFYKRQIAETEVGCPGGSCTL